MNVALRRPMTLDEFLAWEAKQELKFEFDGFEPVGMTGVRGAHAGIQRNLLVALSIRLRGKKCLPFGSDLKIEVAGHVRYPDAFIVCTPVAPDTTVVRDPVVVFEILSDTTARTDRIIKNEEYRATPSIRRYVMLEQDVAAATIFSRKGDDWVGHILSGPNAILALPEVGIELPLAELYVDIEPVEIAPQNASIS